MAETILKTRVKAKEHTNRLIQCTVIDQFVKELPASLVFFYEKAIDYQVLENSLSTILKDFPIFAGTLKEAKGDLHIDCDNQGVRFSVERHQESCRQVIETLFEKGQREKIIDILKSNRVLKKGDPPCTIKINYLSDGGMALGICWHHSVGDMRTFMSFMEAWSNHTGGKDYPQPILVDDRRGYLLENLKDNGNTTPGVKFLKIGNLLKLVSYIIFKAKDWKMAQFYFTEAELQKSRQDLSQKSGMSLSINDTLCARMFSAITRLDPREAERFLGITIDFRSRGHLPDTLLGNIITSLNVKADHKTSPEDLAKKIREHINHYDEKHMDYYSNLRFLEEIGGKKRLGRCLSKAINPMDGCMLITSWSKFGVYDIDFGGEAPFYFTEHGEFPFPWLHGIMDGFGNQGLIFNAILPTKLIDQLTQPESLKEIHQFRDPDEPLPELAESLDWIY